MELAGVSSASSCSPGLREWDGELWACVMDQGKPVVGKLRQVINSPLRGCRAWKLVSVDGCFEGKQACRFLRVLVEAGGRAGHSCWGAWVRAAEESLPRHACMAG